MSLWILQIEYSLLLLVDSLAFISWAFLFVKNFDVLLTHPVLTDGPSTDHETVPARNSIKLGLALATRSDSNGVVLSVA